MAEKKISRKKLLKEPDEFISTTTKIIQFLREHNRQMLLYGVIVLAGVVGVFGFFYYLSRQQGRALVVQQEAFQLYQETFRQGGSPEKEKDQYRKSLEKFKEALSVSGRGSVGEVSRIYVGHCHYSLQEYDQAIAAYVLCLEGPFRAMALNGLGYCYEAKGDYSKAMENYQKNMEESLSPYQMEDTLAVARCYEALKQKEKALEVYQKALAKNPSPNITEFIQWKIGEIKG